MRLKGDPMMKSLLANLPKAERERILALRVAQDQPNRKQGGKHG